MSTIGYLPRTLIFIAWMPLLQLYSQPLNSIVKDTIITAAAVFSAHNSIAIGPGLTIAQNGDATFATGGIIYLTSGITVVQGGRLRAINDASLVVHVQTPEAPMPSQSSLQQNYPNPFNPSTTIRFALKHRSHVILVVFNVLGQSVRTLVNDELPAGEHQTRFFLEGLPSGIYIYRITTNGFDQSRRMLVIK